MTVKSSFRINQPPGTPYANWDRARRDIVLGAVECEALNKSEITYRWEMFSAPFGVTVAIVNGTLHTCNFTLATRGGYLIRLTVNEGLLNESVTTLYLGVPLENTGLCIPSTNETNQDNSQTPYTGVGGWSDKAEQFYRKVDEQYKVENLKTAGGAGTVPTSDGAGNLSMAAPVVAVHDLDGVKHTGIAGTEHNFMGINASGKPKDSGSKASDFAPSSHGLSGSNHTGVAGAENNFMALDASGKPKDSGSKASDFAPATHGLNSATHSGITGSENNFMALDASGKPKDSGKSASSFYEPGNEIKIKVYSQNSQPSLSADQMMAIWIDTDDSNKTYLLFRRGTGDYVAVELS